MIGRLARGAVSGTLGTAALSGMRPIEERLLGGTPAFAPERIARGLSRRLGGRVAGLSPARLGAWMRWSYGPGWGVLYALAGGGRAHRPLVSGIVLGAAIYGFELVTLPSLVGRRRLLRAGTLAALALHVGAFAATTVAVQRLLERAPRPPG